MRRDAEVVKTLPRETGASAIPPAARPGFGRHFEGYELGLATVGMVLTFAILASPRASRPTTLPLPRVDRAEARQSATEERELATRAETAGLPFAVRAVGEAVRSHGRASARGEDSTHAEEDIRARVRVVLDANQAPLLLRLRAVQTQYFLTALRQFERDGKQSAELDELGGDFVDHARRNGWLDGRGQLLPDEATVRVLFRLHWADLIGKKAVFPFAPSLNEWRIYYRFLLQHPERGARRTVTPARAPGAEAATARLRLAAALGRRDPDYPADMAQGLLLFQLGETEASAIAYRRQLGKHPGGPYALLARNYLIYALQEESSE